MEEEGEGRRADCVVKRIATVLSVAVAAFFAAAVSAYADAHAQKTVRVAFCGTHGYYVGSPTDSPKGIVPEWVERMARVAGWKVEWVETTQAEAVGMVARGELDLVGCVSMHSERAKDLLYTHQPMGLRNTAVYVLRSSPFEYGDLASLDGCVVGMQSGQERIDRIADHLAKHGARCEFREFDDADSLERALFEGRVGAVASEDSPRLSAEKSVVTLPPAPLYFVTPTSRGDLLAEADDAMAYILAGEPDLVRTLSDIYLPFRYKFDMLFTSEERAFISRCSRSNRSFTIDLSPEQPPFKRYDQTSGNYAGFLGALVDELRHATGLSFDVVPPLVQDAAETRFARGGADVWIQYGHAGAGIGQSAISSGARRFSLRVPQACCTRRLSAQNYSDPTARLAVWRHDLRRLEAYSKLGYEARVVRCRTKEDSFKAILDGRADCVVCAYPEARSIISSLNANGKFDVRTVEFMEYDPAYPVVIGPHADMRLAGIVAKAVRAMSRDRIVDLTLRAEAHEMREGRMSPEQIAVLTGAILFAAALALIGVLAVSRRRISKALHKEHMALKLADDAIKEVGRTNEKLKDALAHAENAAMAKSTFLATMSHEIRTPLNSVIGFAEFLSDPKVEQAKVPEYARSISHSASALLSLINDILDLSKFESGKTEGLDIRTGETDVRHLFDEMDSVFKMRAADKKLTITFEVSESMPVLRIAEPRLRQILLNLVGNAIKFTDTGGVTVSATYAGGFFELRICDTGIGISPRGLKHIFEPFSQDMASRRGKVYAGTGLGLSIVKRLVDASEGTIQVRSELGKGTTFVVTLRKVEKIDAPLGADIGAGAVPGALCGKITHVILVDDIAMNRKILSMYCQSLGITDIKAYSSAQEVLDHLDAGDAADVILSDLWMPLMDGSELARQVAKRRPGLPVVAVTADTDAGASFDIAAFRSILSKPVTSAKLKALFEKLERAPRRA